MEPDKQLTDKQQRFVEEYCVDCNGTQAAIRAGYSVDSAASIGSENLTKPNIRTAINERLAALAMSADEAVKHVSDIAATRLNDYLKIEVRQRGTKIEQPLAEAIAALDAEIAFEKEYTRRSLGILSFDEEGLEEYQGGRQAVVRRLLLKRIKWEIVLENNPGATHEIEGPPEAYEAVAVDMIALAKASTTGRIKTLSWSEFGPKVEMYAADAALVNILKLNGRFVERTDITSGGKAFTATVEIIASGPPLATNEKEIDDAL